MTFFYREHKLVLLIDISLPWDFNALFRVGLLYYTCCGSFAEEGSDNLLTELPSAPISLLYNKWELSIGSTAILSDRLLLHSIFRWYIQDKILEIIETLLEVILFKEVDLSLLVSLTSISIPDGNLAIFKTLKLILVEEKCLFASSLMGTTIQDSGIRERNNVFLYYYLI